MKILVNSEKHISLDNLNCKLAQVIPYETRLKIYNEHRNRIFGNTPGNLITRRKLRSALRHRQFWKRVKTLNTQSSASICSIKLKSKDLRPYAEIFMLNGNRLGLLDSGAQVSCIGGILAKNICGKGDLNSIGLLLGLRMVGNKWRLLILRPRLLLGINRV